MARIYRTHPRPVAPPARGGRRPGHEAAPGDPGILAYDDFIADVGAVVVGATTYQWVLDHAETVDGAWVFAQPSFVFTHRDLAPADGITPVSGPPADHRAALEEAAAGKDVWIVGGGDLAADFARAGMLDEVFVSLAPVTLGAGKPLLGGRFDLALREHGTNGALLEARYAVLGERGVGSSDRDATA